MSNSDWWLSCCDMPGPLHADSCVLRVNAQTIDGVRVTPGLRVIDYNLDLGTVRTVHHVARNENENRDVPWFDIELDKGGSSMMDGLRLWTRLATNSGTIVAAQHCGCGDSAHAHDPYPGEVR